MAHPLPGPLQAFLEAFNKSCKGEPCDPYVFLAPDVSVFVNGSTPVSGSFKGTEIVRLVLVGYLAPRLSEISASCTNWLQEGNRAMVRMNVEATPVQSKPSESLKTSLSAIFTLDNDRITRIQIFPDTVLMETHLFNQRFVDGHNR